MACAQRAMGDIDLIAHRLCNLAHRATASRHQRPSPQMRGQPRRPLPPHRRKIVEMRFGLNGERTHTLYELGERFQLSTVRVRQIIETALCRIKEK